MQTLVPLELAQNPCIITPNQSFATYGYPIKPNKESIYCVVSESLISSLTDIKHCLCGGNYFFCSVGRIIAGDEVISASLLRLLVCLDLY